MCDSSSYFFLFALAVEQQPIAGTNIRRIQIEGDTRQVVSCYQAMNQLLHSKDRDEESNKVIFKSMLVPAANVGRLIGKAGAIIKQISEYTGWSARLSIQFASIAHNNESQESTQRF